MDTTTTQPEKTRLRGQPSLLAALSVCTEHRNKKDDRR